MKKVGADKARLQTMLKNHAKELGVENLVNKIANMKFYQAKRHEIKEANKKNKILKYLREQTMK